ncbi:SixA phosphatase family protein [Mycolicibacterium palauense]|uniref:SixA phosphatase family protein n=1 Tax=Mycolicibacterium palauense TaxID=2034511 RepID=UPI000BFEAE8D|nr:histidine phosphatase family protein [Mycolicibacterium palauense]
MSEEPRTLILLRHAKSDYPDGVADHDRPLAARGRREAGLAGDWLRAEAPLGRPVQAVLCSTATRTRETLDRTGVEAPVRFVERLYGATPGGLIEVINSAAGDFDFDVRTLLVIGHEPAISQVALGLAGAPGSNETAAERISTKYPTSAMAVLRVPGPWGDLGLGGAVLETFFVPR